MEQVRAEKRVVRVELDKESGFCPGVIRAVECAEKNLRQCGALYSLGAIVHNGSELQRLEDAGLKVVDIEGMRLMHDATVLIRAHGEPPATYDLARANNIELIDCTCPVVLKLQEKIRNIYHKGGAQVLIFGKEGHAEVNGLVGQVGGDAVILDVIKENGSRTSDFTDGENFFLEHDGVQEREKRIRNFDKIDWSRDLVIFSQTTKDPAEYDFVCRCVRDEHARRRAVKVYDTICRQVSHRHTHLREFAARHTVVIFVSGAESSNGKVLFDLCKGVNPLSYHIQSIDQIQMEWFNSLLAPAVTETRDDFFGTGVQNLSCGNGARDLSCENGVRDVSCERDQMNVTNGTKWLSVGVCGATSTPKWQLEQVVSYLREQLNR